MIRRLRRTLTRPILDFSTIAQVRTRAELNSFDLVSPDKPTQKLVEWVVDIKVPDDTRMWTLRGRAGTREDGSLDTDADASFALFNRLHEILDAVEADIRNELEDPVEPRATGASS